jgi:quercetin dioxygenase-like cupin family protein
LVLQKKNFDKPDETMAPPRMRRETISLGNLTVRRFVFQPGWRWSKDVKPIAKTSSCPAHHFGVLHSGKLMVRADDGQEMEYGPGDVMDIPPGHDGWTLGEEPAVYYEFECKPGPK